MSIINGSYNNRISPKQNMGGTNTRPKEGEKTSQKEITESPKAQSNKMILEMHLKIQLESKKRFGTQAGIKRLSDSVGGFDLSRLEYNGKAITALTQEEAQGLVSEDGYFEVEQTAERISSFAVSGAGDDLEKLKAGRDAVLKGFKEAEDLMGGNLPGISHETIEKAIETIDEKIRLLGGSVVDVAA